MPSVGGVLAGQAANISGTSGTQTKKKDVVGRDEFLQLLITQLKNQDPEAPMDSKEFAVQLAQFTQVEKLISIDEQMTKQSQNAGSMAGYLGQQVILNSSDAAVKGGNGGQVQLNLAQDAQNIRVQFVDGSGKVVGEKVVDQLSKGKQLVTLDGLTIPDGTYSVQVKASSRFGAGDFRVPVAAAGLVSGFIPGPDPKLIVNGREIGVGEIQEVTLPSPA
jgi:flagellar basal-body rod modification protein FlgD